MVIGPLMNKTGGFLRIYEDFVSLIFVLLILHTQKNNASFSFSLFIIYSLFM